MKIVITGGNGYLGARLSMFLAEQGFEIIPLCYPEIPPDLNWTNIMYKVLKGNITDKNTINEIVSVNPDVIIHLISFDHHESEKNPQEVALVNVLPTWNLLNACSDLNLKKFIYFSTIHVYGNSLNGYIYENQIPSPLNAYGLTHYLSEEIGNYYNRKTSIDCINIRLSNSYGEPVFPDANCWTLIVNDLCRTAYLHQEIRLKSEGSALRDFIHYSDICNGVHTLLTDRSPLAEKKRTMHFSSGKSISMLEVAKTVRDVYNQKFGRLLPLFINGNELWVNEELPSNQHVNVSNELAKSYEINFSKELLEGILDLFNYLERNICRK